MKQLHSKKSIVSLSAGACILAVATTAFGTSVSTVRQQARSTFIVMDLPPASINIPSRIYDEHTPQDFSSSQGSPTYQEKYISDLTPLPVSEFASETIYNSSVQLMAMSQNKNTTEQLAEVPGAKVPLTTELFRELMKNPGDPELNTQYAKEVEKNGDIHRALQAYQRIILTHPDNASAKAEIDRLEALLTPPETKISIALGGAYETNSPKRDPRFLSYDDTAATIGFLIDDKRQITGMPWQTKVQGFGSAHNRWRQGNLAFVGLDSGPTFYLENGWNVRVAPTVSYAWLDGKGLFAGTGIKTDWNAPKGSALRKISASAGYDNFLGSKSSRSGAVAQVKSTHMWTGLVTKEDAVIVRPSYKFVGSVGNSGEFRYHQGRIEASYSAPLMEATIWSVSAGIESRLYGGHAADEANNRRDFKVDPGLALTFKDILPANGDIVSRYKYEMNWSNDYDKRFEAHTVGVNTQWTF